MALYKCLIAIAIKPARKSA